jgi:hypothetical protein
MVRRIVPINDAPTISSIADKTITEDENTIVTFNVTDVETLDISTFDFSLDISDTSILERGSIEIVTQNNSAVVTLNINSQLHASGSTSITVNITDNKSEPQQITQENFNLTITPVNDAPYSNRKSLKFEGNDTKGNYLNNNSYSYFSDELMTSLFEDNNNSSFTITFWFQYEGNGNLLTLHNRESWRIAVEDGSIDVKIGDSHKNGDIRPLLNSPTLQPNTMNHFAIIKDEANTQMQVFINGESIIGPFNYKFETIPLSNGVENALTVGLFPPFTINQGDKLAIGAFEGGVYGHNLKGYVDNINIWNEALTAQSINEIIRTQC